MGIKTAVYLTLFLSAVFSTGCSKEEASRVAATTAFAGSTDLTVSWTPNTEADLNGYRLSYGTSPGSHPNVVDVGIVTSYRVTGLTTGVTYALGAAPNWFNYTINATSTLVSVTTSAYTPIYWRGGQDWQANRT
jgi:hypothetical protein